MLNLLLLITVIFLSLFLGVLILKRSKNNFANLLFSTMIFASIAWSVFNYFADFQNIDYESALLLGRITFLFGLLIPALFFGFAIYFGGIIKRAKVFIVLGGLALLIGSLISLTSLVVQSLNKMNWGWDISPGGLYFLYVTIFIFYISFAFYFLFIKFKNSHGVTRNQIKYMLLGTILTSLFSASTNMFLPLIMGTNPYAKYGPYFFMFLIGFTAYAIIKHRLMDIRMVVARSVAYSLMLLFLSGIYTSSIFIIQTYIFKAAFAPGYIATQVALVVIMVFLFQPLRRWITKVTDRVFFKEQYDVEELLDKIAHTVSSSIIMIEILYKTLDVLISEMKITRGMLIVFDDSGKILETQSIGYKDNLKTTKTDLISITRDGILLFDELSENSKYKKILEQFNASVAIPLKSEAGIAGVLILGEKESGDMFSSNDLKVFEIIGPEIAVAVNNAKSYEKIEKFNITLRQEIKKATYELERKNEQLRELDKAKDEFISMASHQLRTPLTAIKGYLSMLLEGDAGEIKVSQYDFVNEAFQGANRMVGLINDLLNVSRMETGRFFLEPKEVDMERVVNEEVGQLRKQAKEKGLKLDIIIKGKIPSVWVDETKIRQVVMNFADNAIYYTTSGSVTVTLEHNKKEIIYKVKDTGIGVPKSQQKNLFTKFYRADNARHVRPDGTGLGIYLAKKVIDDHSGELIFESEEGKGSIFGFKLPIKSKLKVKRVSAPEPRNHTTPGIGELAAGIGVNPETLEATSAAGVEHPLADSSDVEDLEKTIKSQKKSAEATKEKQG